MARMGNRAVATPATFGTGATTGTTRASGTGATICRVGQAALRRADPPRSAVLRRCFGACVGVPPSGGLMARRPPEGGTPTKRAEPGRSSPHTVGRRGEAPLDPPYEDITP